MKLYQYTLAVLLAASLSSCGEDWLTEYPSNEVTSAQLAEAAAQNPESTVSSLLNGVYRTWNQRSNLSAPVGVGYGGLMVLMNTMSNDMSCYKGTSDPFHFDHTLDYSAEQYNRAGSIWGFSYTLIKQCNEVINVLDESAEQASARAILAQAYAIRGYAYSMIAQFYQKAYSDPDIDPQKALSGPIYITEKEGKSNPARVPLAEMYERIETDLLKSIALFGNQAGTGGSASADEKAKINRNVAQGLLSRVYLTQERWEEAAKMAHEARQGYTLMSPETVATFNFQDLTNSEVMWGMHPNKENTLMYASFQSWMSYDDVGYGGQAAYYQLIDAALYKNFNATDARIAQFVKPGTTEKTKLGDKSWEIPGYCPKKFKRVNDWLGDVIYMRVSEMYLTEAEALAHKGDESGALAVMKEFMAQRDPAWNATSVSPEFVYTQRRLELWGEGFAYFDHKRWRMDLKRKYAGTNELSALQVDIPHTSYLWTYQVPKMEIRDNNAISQKDQNPYE